MSAVYKPRWVALARLRGYGIDGQRFEMVFATALKERLKAGAAIKVGFEWFYCRDLHLVQWEEELKAATVTALHFSGLEQPQWNG